MQPPITALSVQYASRKPCVYAHATVYILGLVLGNYSSTANLAGKCGIVEIPLLENPVNESLTPLDVLKFS